ncbi:MAG: DNA internalization-related competence protein ComEC/Rec2 [Lachnospiraceae bacterium]|nr:DNA internalization-related competence protein ComEC/Rec2 [Lachnospiraceae bacterium]
MKRPMCWLAGLFFLILSVFVESRSWKESTAGFLETEVLLTGRITQKQEKEGYYGKGWELRLAEVVLKREEKLLPLKGNYLLRLTTGEELLLGQKILVKASFSPWEESKNPGQFDLGKWYHSQGILGEFRGKELIKKSASYQKFGEALWHLRVKASAKLRQLLGETEGALLSAMILGEKSFLEEESKEMYQRNGISHILAISGLHLMLLGNGIYTILKRILPVWVVPELSACTIMILFCFFSGASISTLRATIMFVMTLLGKILGRTYDSLSALGLAAAILLWKNPYVMENSGFLLSFLAVIGVVYAAPAIHMIFPWENKLWKSLTISLSASLTTLPVLLVNYGAFSWYSVFLNLLILPPMAFILAGGILLLLCSFLISILPPFDILMWIQHIFIISLRIILAFYEQCCYLFEQLPFQDGYLGAVGKGRIFLYYLLLFLLLRIVTSPKDIKKLYPNFWNGIFLFLLLTFLTCRIPGGFEITMLDVGQGDCVIIRNANQKVYISDCGSSSISRVGKYRLLPFLKYKGYGNIEAVFISHLDEDHYNGILELLEAMDKERIKISYLVLPKEIKKLTEQKQKLEELLFLAEEKKIQTVFMKGEDRILDGKMEILCLHPREGDYTDNANEDSMVLDISYGEFTLLLTGDVEGRGEEKLTACLKNKKQYTHKQYEILKVAHHGAKGSTTEEFLQQIRPKLGLISCGRDNRYGHPAEETLKRLEKYGVKILDTREGGAITIKVNKKGTFWKADTFCP